MFNEVQDSIEMFINNMDEFAIMEDMWSVILQNDENAKIFVMMYELLPGYRVADLVYIDKSKFTEEQFSLVEKYKKELIVKYGKLQELNATSNETLHKDLIKYLIEEPFYM